MLFNNGIYYLPLGSSTLDTELFKYLEDKLQHGRLHFQKLQNNAFVTSRHLKEFAIWADRTNRSIKTNLRLVLTFVKLSEGVKSLEWCILSTTKLD